MPGSDFTKPPQTPKAPQTPKSPIRIVTEPSPRAFNDSFDSSSPKGLGFYLQNTSHNAASTPISAIFLVQFDVRSGYELKWFKKIDNSISLKGVEYKSLPSGLHEVEREVISFVQSNNVEKVKTDFQSLLYGVSVFHQNLKDSSAQPRSKVKMFSLGILVDPSLQNSRLTNNLKWAPVNYTKGLEYIDQLHELLDDWDTTSEDYTDFEKFFDENSRTNILQQSVLQSPRSYKQSPSLSKNQSKHHSHHYLLQISNLLEILGPLIFRVFRSTLLRESIILFDAPSVEQNCSFAYCLSILATIPQEIVTLLSESGAKIDSNLKFIQPVYSVGVNDIDWLQSLTEVTDNETNKPGFIASSSDEILLFKNKLYDVSVQFNATSHSSAKIPKVQSSDSVIPGSNPQAPYKATQRDLKRFKILVKEFQLYNSDALINDDLEKKVIENDEFKWWNDVTTGVSWRQLAWTGFYWWATAGEKGKLEEEQEFENISEVDNSNEVSKALNIVGYFQSMTKRIFLTLIDIINNEESSVKSNNDNINGNNSNDDDDNDDENGVFINDPLVIELTDIFEMGLDPYSKEDAKFVIDLVKVWWNREVKIGSSLTNFCCL